MFKKQSIRLIVIFGFIALVPSIDLGSVQCFGQGLPTANDIINNTRLLQVPTTSYRVNVIQRITTSPSRTVQSSTPSVSGIAEFEPGKGLRRISTDYSNTSVVPRAPTIMVDLEVFLDELISYNGVTVESIDLHDRPHFLLSGQDDMETKELLIWVDQEYQRVSRLQLSISDQPFAEVDVEYAAKENNFWLPVSMRVHHFTDDSRIVLEFSSYTFSQ